MAKSTLLWPHYTTIKKIFISHLFTTAQEKNLSLFSMSLLARLFGLISWRWRTAKVDDLGVYLSAPLQDRNVVHVVCAIIYKTNHFLPIKRESAQKRVGVCAHNAMHAKVCVLFFLAQPVWRILGYSILLAPHIYTSRMCGLKIYGRFAQ